MLVRVGVMLAMAQLAVPVPGGDADAPRQVTSDVTGRIEPTTRLCLKTL